MCSHISHYFPVVSVYPLGWDRSITTIATDPKGKDTLLAILISSEEILFFLPPLLVTNFAFPAQNGHVVLSWTLFACGLQICLWLLARFGMRPSCPQRGGQVLLQSSEWNQITGPSVASSGSRQREGKEGRRVGCRMTEKKSWTSYWCR